jgi:uroporphyrinogen III methyltransferase/synthase
MIGRPTRRRVVVTESEGPGLTLAARLADAGVDVRMVPVVVHTPAPDPGPLDDALARLGEFDWVVFTSARAVDVVCERPAWRGVSWAPGSRPRVAAVGPITRERLEARGVPVALCPPVPGGGPLADALVAAEGGTLANQTILWPRSNIARPELRDALRAAGADVVAPVAYCTMAVTPPDVAELVALIDAGEIDSIAFLSPSGASAFAAAMPGGTLACLAAKTIVASVGPTTSAALTEREAPPAIEAASRTAGGLAAALLSYFGLNQSHLS